MQTLRFHLWAVALLLACVYEARAAHDGERWPDNLPPPPDIRLIAAEPALSTKGRAQLGLDMRLGREWITYWEHPGASGLTPQFDWSASGNLASARLLFPGPERIPVEGGASFGYTGEVLFPVEIAASDPSRPVHIVLKARYGICNDEICVPVDDEFALELAPAPAAPDTASRPDAQRIAAWAARVPDGKRRAGGLRLVASRLVKRERARVLRLRLGGYKGVAPLHIITLSGDGDYIEAGAPDIRASGRVSIPLTEDATSPIRIILTHKNGTLEAWHREPLRHGEPPGHREPPQ